MTPGTLAGLALAAVTFALWWQRPFRAVMAYAVLGALPLFTAFEMSGDRITQGLLPVSMMASVFVAVWVTGLAKSPGPILPVERTLVWLLAAAVLSLASGYLMVDPAVDAAKVKPAVSVGQLLLLLWPVASAVIVSRSLESLDEAVTLIRLLTWCAIPSVIYPLLAGDAREYISWSVYFALAAGPFLVARAFDEVAWPRRLLLLVVPVMPLVYGLLAGKAFLYGFVLASTLTVAWIRARLAVAAVAAVAIGALLLSAAVTGRLPGPFERLVAVERQQGSWGGRAGRIALAQDTLGIWSGRPLLGVGPGNNWPYMNRYSVIDTPHNQYLNTLLEQGLVGLILLVLFIGQAATTGWRLYLNAATPEIEWLALGWLGSFAGIVAGCMTGDFLLHSIRNGGLEMFSGFYLHWVLLGLMMALVRLNDEAVAAQLESAA